MAAAETGTGKTGAFSLPVLQIVHETLALKAQGREAAANASAAAAAAAAATTTTTTTTGAGAGHHTGTQKPQRCRLNVEDRDDIVSIDPLGVTCQARSELAWGGCRATVGVFSGKVYFEATVKDEGLCRLGWSTLGASLELGTDKGGFGFGGTGKKSHAKSFEEYGESFGVNDVVTCWLDCASGEIGFSKNGRSLGVAFITSSALRGQPLFPAISLKNAEVELNFGGFGTEVGVVMGQTASFSISSSSLMRYPPPSPDYLPLGQALEESTATWEQAIAASSSSNGSVTTRKPLALILEPARDLAEQTFVAVSDFAKHMTEPSVRAALFVGGLSSKDQVRSLKEGVDIVVGTPGRIMDLLEREELAVDQVKFFVLDEADRLLDTGNRDAIGKLFRKLPKSGAGAARLQVLMFSATLHSPEIRQLASQICENPVVIDLKGKDAVPDTVDHVVINIDPREDRTWLQMEPVVDTDGMHAVDPPLSPTSSSKEAWSEAIKRLKPRMLVRLLDTLKAEQAIVFCRTNYDCDNLEKFLNRLGAGGGAGGGEGNGKRKRPGGNDAYSCMVLAGARTMEERRAALAAFKDGEVRILISTDVAARGIDIQGLPLVVNMTLPDRSEDYVHRVGRVGRADAIGLAVSLVSSVPEKVWFCTQKGLKPWLHPDKKNTRLNEQGGHAIWWDESGMLKEVEKRLGKEVPALPVDLSLPPEIASRASGSGGELKYGQGKGAGTDTAFAQEVAQRAASVGSILGELSALEHRAQASFFGLKSKWTSS